MLAFERIAENLIQEAINEGKFQNLANAGQPLSLDEYFAVPEERRLAYSVLKNAGIAPPEVELMQKIQQLNKSIDALDCPIAKQKAKHEQEALRVQLRMLLERRGK